MLLLLMLLLGRLVLLASAEEAEPGAAALSELDGLHDGHFFSGVDAVGFGAARDGLLLERGGVHG